MAVIITSILERESQWGSTNNGGDAARRSRMPQNDILSQEDFETLLFHPESGVRSGSVATSLDKHDAALREEIARLKTELKYADGRLFNLQADRKLAAEVLGTIGPLVGFEPSELGWIGLADAIKSTVTDLRSRLEAAERRLSFVARGLPNSVDDAGNLEWQHSIRGTFIGKGKTLAIAIDSTIATQPTAQEKP